MRFLIILAAFILLMAVVGWISFSSDGNRSSIILETDEIREDTGELMHKRSDLLRDAKQEVTAEENDPVETATPVR